LDTPHVLEIFSYIFTLTYGAMAYTSNQPGGMSNPAMQNNGPLPQVS
jgi:hypothetical protein